MKKEETADEINKAGFIGALIFILLMVLFLYYATANRDKTCLENIATNVCIENNLTYDSYSTFAGDKSIFCKKDYNPREDYRAEGVTLYFLDSELEQCLIKKEGSFRRIK
jgi:hypothetical protein